MNLSELISNLIAAARSDLNKAALPALAAFFNSIATDTTAINITVQLAKLNADLIAALPGIERSILAGIAKEMSAAAAAIAKR
jgi:glycerol-3-phosphate responsive antiterminator